MPLGLEASAKYEEKMATTNKKKMPRNYLILKSKKLATSWWGKAWNTNLESYSDFSNRLPRARTYLRGGKVFDLEIETGLVTAFVQGSRKAPYKVVVRILPLSDEKKTRILGEVNRRVENLESLMQGEFPDELNLIFTKKGEGLFPTTDEIDFACTCPDWAYLCKHVGAVLYGIGAMFDEDPALFFKLRGLDMQLFIYEGLQAELGRYLAAAEAAGADVTGAVAKTDATGKVGKANTIKAHVSAEASASRIIRDNDLDDIFGV